MIVIIDGCGANIVSIQFAIKRLGIDSCVTTNPRLIQSASHVILPGVGTANHAMAQLHKFQLVELIGKLQQPILGICLGMQLFYEYSQEGNTACLGIIPEKITRLANYTQLTIPHMGWNKVKLSDKKPLLLKGIKDTSYFYFIHSYAAPINKKTIATSEYSQEFSAIVQNNNFYGVQFHPERSGKVGEQLLQNFLALK